MIKNIVFDIGNIILEGTPSNCLKYLDIDDDSKKIIKHVVFENEKFNELDYGYITLNEYYNSICMGLPEKLRNIGRETLNNSYKVRKINSNILELIKKLHKNKYKIYILSDNNIDTYKYLKSTEVENFISGWCVSAVYHKTKANNELYDVLLNEFNLKPEECYFIDDKQQNIKQAKQFGIKGFMLDWQENDFNKLISNMKETNIKI